MKSIVLPAPGSKADRQAYAIKRMNSAAQRMLYAQTSAEEIQAGYWVLAWAVAAGARPSARSLRDADSGVASLVKLRLH